jgi:hypothetical protein
MMEPRSISAINFNLRRYSATAARRTAAETETASKVRNDPIFTT